MLGPDGGVIGIAGPDGGLIFLPDGGVVGGPCMPSQCTEVACGDGIDNDSSGQADCADPACNYLTCNDANTCTLGDRCVSLSCQGQTTVSCPAPGMCDKPMPTCLGTTCIFAPNVGASCGSGNVCLPDRTCGVIPGTGQFNFTPSNFDPTMIAVTQDRVVIAGAAGFDTSTNSFTGTWPTLRPMVTQVTTPTGPAVVLAAEGFDVNAGASLRVVGDKPLILAATETVEIYGTIDVSAAWVGNTPVPGPGGGVNCGSANGGSGSGSTTAAGGGGAGGVHGPGGAGGGGSTFTMGSTGGTQRAFGAAGDLVPGCNGGNGGNAGGLGGAGGGAIQITAGYGIFVSGGAIFANGIGGRGGIGTVTGGGGAGSGGTILLESPNVTAQNSLLIAAGGGGGEGAGRLSFGRDGQDGQRFYSYWGAAGGGGFSGNGGNGGQGGARNNQAYPGQPGTQYFDEGNTSYFEAGGGGGGGAAGKLRATITPGGQCIVPHEHVWQSPAMSHNDGARNCYY